MTSPKNEDRKHSVSTEGDDSVAETLAERRALHNSVERTRREALNGKFTHLAQQLPSLAHIHRPSKSVIISHCLDMVLELKETKAENELLRQELFHLRLALTGASHPVARSHAQLSGQTELLLANRHESMDPSRSPRQQRRHERTPLSSASPRNYRAGIPIYATSLPSSYHRPQMRQHQRHSVAGNSRMHEEKNGGLSMWHEGASRSVRMQPDVYPLPDYALANEHFSRLNSQSSHSTAMSELQDSCDFQVTPFFPVEYGSNFELSVQQQTAQQAQTQGQSQPYLKSEESEVA